MDSRSVNLAGENSHAAPGGSSFRHLVPLREASAGRQLPGML